MGFSTDAIHAGQKPDAEAGAITVPIYQTSTYVQEGLGKHKGYEYGRTQNPTREAVEANLAALEQGSNGIAFASGMAATNAVLSLLQAGDHIIVSENVYGGTYRLFEKILRKFHLDFSWVDTSKTEKVEKAFKKNTRLVFVETPTNPIMTISDVRAISEVCQQHQSLLAVDNTFLSPYLQRPLTLGADLVVHSTTKFLNGHSDSIGGVVITKNAALAEDLYFIQNAAGAILSPFDSFLLLRGTKTLAIRMRQHDENGRKIAAFLSSHPKVNRVYYPGLPDHPHHELASRQQFGYGALVALELAGLEEARRMLENVHLCSLAESLGGVETLISHPAIMTHASVPREQREHLGITDGLIRISVGIEDIEDLFEDLDQALEKA